jgi:hypothetical protein
MDETRIIALRALRELLDDAGPDDWDDLVASYRALHNAITKNKPMTRKDCAHPAFSCGPHRLSKQFCDHHHSNYTRLRSGGLYIVSRLAPNSR